jgi:hypothetical protein
MTGTSQQECVSVGTNKENQVPSVNKMNRMPVTRDTSLMGHKMRQLGLMLVRGCLWSPSIYKNARKAGLCVDAAWRTSFVQ